MRMTKRKKQSHPNHRLIYKIRAYWDNPKGKYRLRYTPTIKVNEKTMEIESDIINDFTAFRTLQASMGSSSADSST